jgi:hypothetical protein
VPHLGAVTRSESAIYYFSSADRGGIYAYAEERPVEIGEKIRPVLELVTSPEDVFVGWGGKQLWCSMPFGPGGGVPPSVSLPGTPGAETYVFDPDVGQGVWLRFQSAQGSLGPLVARSDIEAGFPLGIMKGDTGTSCAVQLEYREDARDRIWETPFGDFLSDAADNDLLTEGGDTLLLAPSDAAADSSLPFEAYYRTNWINADWPERRKSWRRPRYIIRTPQQAVTLQARVFWDYDDVTERRVLLGTFAPGSDTPIWSALGADDPSGRGFDWGDGTKYSAGTPASALNRTSAGAGWARAIAVEVRGDPETTNGAPWVLESIHFKYRLRRFTS